MHQGYLKRCTRLRKFLTIKGTIFWIGKPPDFSAHSIWVTAKLRFRVRSQLVSICKINQGDEAAREEIKMLQGDVTNGLLCCIIHLVEGQHDQELIVLQIYADIAASSGFAEEMTADQKAQISQIPMICT